MSKLEKLLETEGYDTLEELAEAVFSASVSPGICINDGCNYTTEVEPDQDRGWGEICGTNTVKSARSATTMVPTAVRVICRRTRARTWRVVMNRFFFSMM